MPNTETEKKIQRIEDTFLKNEVKGVIFYKDYGAHRNYCILKGGYEFYFKWETSKYSDAEFDPSKKFEDYAQKGDSIIKHERQDYFILKKKNGEQFKYYFYVYKKDF